MALAARVLALGLVLGLAPGCFVWEELEAGEEIMEEHGGGFGGPEARSDDPEPSGRSRGEPAPEEEEGGFDPAAWWSKARTLTPGGGSGEDEASGDASSAVLCRLDGTERFMRRDECRGRGGTPAG